MGRIENDIVAIENSMVVPHKTKNRTTMWLISPIYPKQLKSESQRHICTLMFIAASFIMPKIWEQPKCPFGWTFKWIYLKWMNEFKKMFVAYTENEILLFSH